MADYFFFIFLIKKNTKVYGIKVFLLSVQDFLMERELKKIKIKRVLLAREFRALLKFID